MALRAFVDESGTHGPPMMTLGGWVSSVSRWEQFSRDWQACLDASPPVELLKMSHAAKCRGKFHHLSETERDQKLDKFVQIIRDHAMAGIFYRLPYADADKVMSELKAPIKRLNSMYVLALFGLLTVFMKNQAEMGITEPVTFVFDQNEVERTAIMYAWDYFAELWRKDGLPIGSTVTFEDDRKVLPLQAAELMAWYARVSSVSQIGLVYPFVGTKWKLPPLFGFNFRHDATDTNTKIFVSNAAERMRADGLEP